MDNRPSVEFGDSPRDYLTQKRAGDKKFVVLEDDFRVLGVLDTESSEKYIWSGLRSSQNFYDGGKKNTVEYLREEIGIKDDYDVAVEMTQDALEELLEENSQKQSHISSSKQAERRMDRRY